MIKYNLKCENNHEFESWFSDSNDFDKLNKKKLLECIYCSSNKIRKSIMAPMVSGRQQKQENGLSLLDKSYFSSNSFIISLIIIDNLWIPFDTEWTDIVAPDIPLIPSPIL